MQSIKIKTYSPKGLAIINATPEQVEEIRLKLGGTVCTSFNPKLKGWTFSRKRESKIRDIVSFLNDDLPGKW